MRVRPEGGGGLEGGHAQDLTSRQLMLHQLVVYHLFCHEHSIGGFSGSA